MKRILQQSITSERLTMRKLDMLIEQIRKFSVESEDCAFALSEAVAASSDTVIDIDKLQYKYDLIFKE